jgi:hypothetical protein
LTFLDFGALGEKIGNIELNTDLSEKEMRRTSLSEFLMFPICGAPREQATWEFGSSSSQNLARVSPGIVSTISSFYAKPLYTLSQLTIYQ